MPSWKPERRSFADKKIKLYEILRRCIGRARQDENEAAAEICLGRHVAQGLELAFFFSLCYYFTVEIFWKRRQEENGVLAGKIPAPDESMADLATQKTSHFDGPPFISRILNPDISVKGLALPLRDQVRAIK
ncbi:hypothetical protein G6O67_005989 [Ophiocordyceps sinensis]|uniref:Uncharacterized protein n=1 Tax=Ophiocordyceps sinensis TaxID=72228 RepID=A0A8H4PNL3_9HYPO|nr:hypothetical protein G6O67_005989 [Ophiocordyceps sinensis]